jgi:hypothetical protein
MPENFVFSDGSVVSAPTSPVTSAGANVFLFSDAVDNVVDYLGGATQDPEQRIVRRSIYNAYNRIFAERSWAHLYKHTRIQLNPLYNTGTVAYSQSSLTVTLTGGSFPSWAANGRIRINSTTTDGSNTAMVCGISAFPTSTTLLLDANLNPGGDIAAGASYTLFQDVYPLPSDFRKAQKPTTYSTWDSLYISPEDWQWLEWHANVQGYPVRWTIMGDTTNIGQYNLCVQPYPTNSVPFDMIYARGGRNIRYTGYETASRTGTISVTANSTAVTGSGTSWTTAMAGAYMRFSATSTQPDGFGGLNPYVEECRIRSVADGGHLTLYTAPLNTYSATGFVISDPIDLSDQLIEAFKMGCRFQYSVLARTDQHDLALKDYRMAVRLAMENDSMQESARAVGMKAGGFDRGWMNNIPAPTGVH